MRVLVTGGTGYLGRAITAALVRHGHQPIVFARQATRADDIGVARIDGDVRDRGAVRDAARGVDAVIHAAALVSVWRPDPADFDRINVGGLETVIDVCTRLGTPRLVVTSSFLALPPAGRQRPLEANEYQRSKVRAREVVRGALVRGAPIVTVVPGVIYGPGIVSEGNLVGRMIRDHLAGSLPGLIGGDRTWSFAYIDDVAEAHVAAVVQGTAGEEYVAGGENVPQIAAFEIVHTLTGRPLPRRIPTSLAHVLAFGVELRARRGVPPPLTRGTVTILSHDWPLNSDRSVRELSYRITPLREGVQRVLAGAR